MQIFAAKGNVPELPDVAPAVRERARAVRARLDAIRRQAPPPDDQLPAIMDEQLERIRAFGLRELYRPSLIDCLEMEPLLFYGIHLGIAYKQFAVRIKAHRQ